jgi:hypothetical protein
MRFLGSPYPVRKNPRGLLYSQSGINQIKSDLLILLLTNPGERVFLPEFGTPLRNLIFDPNDVILQEKANDLIANAIATWEPRITVEAIEISSGLNRKDLHHDDPGEDLEHILGIKIRFFDPENIVEIQELKLEIPLSNG